MLSHLGCQCNLPNIDQSSTRLFASGRSGLVAMLGILLSVLPLLLVIAAIAGGVYLIVH